MISTENMLPRGHQALIALQDGQVSKLQGLFDKGLATPNDRDDRGRSLLHVRYPGMSPRGSLITNIYFIDSGR